MMRVCVSGLGRAGLQIAKYLLRQENVKLVSGICGDESGKKGADIGALLGIKPLGIKVWSSAELGRCLEETKPHVVIDFSMPKAAAKNIKVFMKYHVRVAMGTTGFTKMQEEAVYSAVNSFGGGLIYAPNITRGVNTMMFLSQLAAKLLEGYDVEVVEMHHSKKLDAPSGTAKKLAGELEKISGGEVPVSAVRAGGIIGQHKVLVVGENDMLEIKHESFSREAFAEGALYAANFIRDKNGIFEMKNLMNYQQAVAEVLAEEEIPIAAGR